MEEKEATIEVSKFTVWYGIVEGEHRNEALRRLAIESPQDFLSFSWTVLIMQPAPLQMLRAFCRNLADKQRDSYIVATTLYDSIRSLQQDISYMRALHPEKDVTVRALCHYAMGCVKTPSEKNRMRRIAEHSQGHIGLSRFRKVIIAKTFRSARAFLNSSDQI